MIIQESGEMYLETILILSNEKPNVRSLDVAEYMGYSKPSVSRAISILKNKKLVQLDSNNYIILTKEGKRLAEKIYERHTVLSDFFYSIGVPKKISSEDACKIEHIISNETFNAIKKHINKK